jgi:hypothetical protein
MSGSLTPPVNPFSYSALAQSVHATLDDAFKAVPDGKRGVLLGKFDEQPDGTKHASFGIATKFGNNWEVAAGADWDGVHNPSVSFGVMDSW